MTHLTIDEICRFVSFKSLDPETLELASRVNTHLLECTECRVKVRNIQDRYNDDPTYDQAMEYLLSHTDEKSKDAEGVYPEK